MLEVPKRDRQAERRTATRQEILEVAWDIAREKGLAELTLRDVAVGVGMRAPSLYSYFDSKNAMYDAMFGQAWSEYLATLDAAEAALPRSPRGVLRALSHSFFDYAVADLARHQLMNQRTIPGFAPSAESYAPAVEVLGRSRRLAARAGVTKESDFDLYVALIGGLVDAQLANDPGGNRWERLLDSAVDMFADHVGIPKPRRTKS
jgi:AcrR family transcriptional regulator